jgi:hypothetical protein
MSCLKTEIKFPSVREPAYLARSTNPKDRSVSSSELLTLTTGLRGIDWGCASLDRQIAR